MYFMYATATWDYATDAGSELRWMRSWKNSSDGESENKNTIQWEKIMKLVCAVRKIH